MIGYIITLDMSGFKGKKPETLYLSSMIVNQGTVEFSDSLNEATIFKGSNEVKSAIEMCCTKWFNHVRLCINGDSSTLMYMERSKLPLALDVLAVELVTKPIKDIERDWLVDRELLKTLIEREIKA